MPKYSLLLAAGLCCLFAHPANSQAVAPVAPRVVTLGAGDVAKQTYVCLDTATYRAVRLQMAQLDPLRQRVALLDYDRNLLAQSLAQQHAAGRVAGRDFDQLASTTQRLAAVVPRPPLLLDGRVYASAGAGILATLLYCLLHP